MLNKKLKTIASLVNKEDVVIDIGCDHAYLAIYLKKNNLCKEAYASDISPNVLKTAKQNIKESKIKITAYLSDGFKNITNNTINTAIISGMGSSTIVKIMKETPNNIKKYIISSNNEQDILRKESLKMGYYVQKEIVVFENHKYYPIILFSKEPQKENNLTLKYGKSNNKEYYEYLLAKEKEIIGRIPKKHFITRLKHIRNGKQLKNIIKRNEDYY